MEAAILAGFTTTRPCDRKGNRPPGPAALAALAAAARVRGHEPREVTVDLARYAELVEVLR